MKIGIFDSGIGGITVLKYLRANYSDHEFHYFGDTANVPYGTKSVTQILDLSSSAASRIKAKDLDCLIVACNTASSLALEAIRSILSPVPVLGVVEAGVQSVCSVLVEEEAPRSVLILGTRATIQSHIYKKLLDFAVPEIRVIEQECPLLVPMIEEGWVNHPILAQTVEEYVRGVAGEPPGIALLGCTHYPWIRHQFQRALPGWKIIDSAEAISELACRELKLVKGQAGAGNVTWRFSDPNGVAQFIFEASGFEAAAEFKKIQKF